MTAAGPEPSELQPDAKEAMSIITSTLWWLLPPFPQPLSLSNHFIHSLLHVSQSLLHTSFSLLSRKYLLSSNEICLQFII